MASRATAEKLLQFLCQERCTVVIEALSAMPLLKVEGVPHKPRPHAQRGRARTITPDVKEFVSQRRGMDPVDLYEMIQTHFGRAIAIGSIYRIWREERNKSTGN